MSLRRRNLGAMNTQPYQRPLELFATRSWRPRLQDQREVRIVSGGQTGVDRGALDAALAVGLGVDVRRMNVQDSDATLILTLGAADGGTRRTAESARRMGKACLVVDLDAADALEKTRMWIAEVRPHVLNIAGPRDSKQPGIYGRSFAFLSRVFRTAS
jgi:hypothetical protein